MKKNVGFFSRSVSVHGVCESRNKLTLIREKTAGYFTMLFSIDPLSLTWGFSYEDVALDTHTVHCDLLPD